jgi:pimeloyl-ACP methyl ester carboxylesterase
MSTTFVLVHGACHGGWSWRPVVERLRARGHAVYTPTLPGLNPGDRRADIHLSDTVDYLVDYVEGHELADIVLVGHSWGGFPVSGAAIRLATPHIAPGVLEHLRPAQRRIHDRPVPTRLMGDVPRGRRRVSRQLRQVPI